MSATTIKLEDPLLSQLRAVIPSQQSLSAFIREVLEADIRRRKLRQAGEQYVAFLAENADECEGLQEWESADLVHAPQRTPL